MVSNSTSDTNGLKEKETPKARDGFHAKGVPLGSILDITCPTLPVDVLLLDGKMEELNIYMEGVEGTVDTTTVEKSETKSPSVRDGTTVYDVQCPGFGCGTAGRIVAEIPPRYFGLRVKTSGNVTVQAGMKEAQLISVETMGNIHCQGSVSAEVIRLVSAGAGSVQASNIMAHICSIDTRSSDASGPVSVGRSSCLEMLVHAGTSTFQAESLLCSNAQVNAGTMTVKNLNTLDGKVHFGIAPSRDSSKVAVKGMDGQLRIAVLPTEKEQVPLHVDIQLNENARSLTVDADSRTCTTLNAAESLDVLVESGDEVERYLAGGSRPTCKVVLPAQSTVRVNRRSWFEAFRQSNGFDGP